jgi:hypothetical protein
VEYLAPSASASVALRRCGFPHSKSQENYGTSVKQFKETSPVREWLKKRSNPSQGYRHWQRIKGTEGFAMSDFEHFLQILGEAERPEVAFV